ncbi:MAG: hypothetical protein ACI8RZ_007060 [Myxococcota bacterium]|jgi:hypothetical protein
MLTSQVLSLASWNGIDDLVFQTLLTGQDGNCSRESRGKWRIVELVSQSGQPFDAELRWTAGNGGNLKALVTVSRATRVGLFCLSLDVRVANLDDAINVVSGVVAPARTFVQTHNQYEVRSGGGSGGSKVGTTYPVEIPIPPFADRLHFYVTDYANRSSWAIAVTDAQGTLRSYTTADTIPDSGLYIGGAGKIEVYDSAQVGEWRAVFSLSI